jgi:protein MPE1
MSKIFYKFKAAKDYDAAIFDGPSLSVFDLKSEIIRAKKLGKGVDFDLAIYDVQTNEEFSDDNTQIARSSSVIVRRLPASKPGKGTAQKYVLENPVASKVIPAQQQPQQEETAAVQYIIPEKEEKVETLSGETEQDKINSLFSLNEQNSWQHNAKNGDGKHSYPAYQDPNRPPPPNYVCYRCGIKGHWLQMCPTQGNKDFDNFRVKKTTGIPRSFLKTVAAPALPPSHPLAMSSGNNAEDGGNPASQDIASGVMVTPSGELVIAQIQDQEWNAVAKKSLGIIAQSYSELFSKLKEMEASGRFKPHQIIPKSLECRMCQNLPRDAVRTSCCSALYCDICIREYLIKQAQEDKPMTCLFCNKNTSVDNIFPEKEVRKNVHNQLRYIENLLKTSTGVDNSTDDSKVNNKGERGNKILNGSEHENEEDISKKYSIPSEETFKQHNKQYASSEHHHGVRTRGSDFNKNNNNYHNNYQQRNNPRNRGLFRKRYTPY